MTMEYQLLFFPAETVQAAILSTEAMVCVLLLMAVFAFWLAPGGLAWALAKRGTHAAIPGPSGLPVFGMLPAFIGRTPHLFLAKLARKLNAVPLMAFSVGFTRFIISSHPDTAKEVLNSSAFADRPVKESAYELLFHRAMGFAPYGEYWRSLRRISATHLFSPKRISGFEGFRREIGLKLVEEIKGLMVERGEVEVRRVLHFGSLNNVMMMVFGRSYDFKRGDGLELEKLVAEGYELLGLFNWNDHFPLLGLLDLQGVRKRCRCLASRVNVFVGKIIEEHRLRKSGGFQIEKSEKDFVDVLFDLEKDAKLTVSDMIAILWEMIFRGTDTVAIFLEWVLARMVLHPEIQSKAQSELDSVVTDSKPVSDSDIPNLPYLQAIVKECLRLHLPGPLLSWARLAIQDVHVGGHLIPAGTTAMVNMWAITHDEKTWPEPMKFKPERFIEEDISILGLDLRLAPFGSGRRVCPGKAMGLATLHLWLAQLLKSFKWVPLDTRDVDLSECLRLSMEMKHPLVCRVISRAA